MWWYYGFFCTKCCWVLMVGLLVVGAMSLPLMGVFTLIIFAEKMLPWGQLISRGIGAAFLAVGRLRNHLKQTLSPRE